MFFLFTCNHRQLQKMISKEFFDLWNLSHVIGAIDGKYIAMDCPKNKGSQYYAYQGFPPQVLLTFCDTKYKFTFIGVRQYGSINHSAVLANSRLDKRLHYYSLNLPDEEVISDKYYQQTLKKKPNHLLYLITWRVMIFFPL